MWSFFVVNRDPVFCNFTHLPEVFKSIGIEYFVAVGFIKALNKGILLRFTRLDKLECNPFFFAPAHKDGRA